jgi:hypothetical protein
VNFKKIFFMLLPRVLISHFLFHLSRFVKSIKMFLYDLRMSFHYFKNVEFEIWNQIKTRKKYVFLPVNMCLIKK